MFKIKKAKGFTLVELIVVIAIIGVLAAILVPAMMGWISKANMRTANAGAKQIFTTAQIIAQELEDTEYSVLSGSTLFDNASFGTSGILWSGDTDYIDSTNTKTFQKEVVREFASKKNLNWMVQFDLGDFESYKPGFNSVSAIGTIISVSYCKDTAYKYIGTYPELNDNTKAVYQSEANPLKKALEDATYFFLDSLVI